MEMKPHIVYVKIDDSGYITAVNSSAFLNDTAGWIQIDEGCGDKYRHAQGNYLPKSIVTDSGVYRYKVVYGKVMECTAEEIAEQEEIAKQKKEENASKTPTHEERISDLEEALEMLLSGVTEE